MKTRIFCAQYYEAITIIKILNLYIILLCTHLYNTYFQFLSSTCNAFVACYNRRGKNAVESPVFFYNQKYSNVHLCFPGPILTYFPPLFQLTKHSPSLRKASRSNPYPSFSNCRRNDVTQVRRCLTSFRQKQLYSTLNLLPTEYQTISSGICKVKKN